jgi:uncharacterized protein YndB with AHSA1/START domain
MFWRSFFLAGARNERGMPVHPLRLETVIEADPERVFEAWVDPRDVSRWYADKVEGDARESGNVRWVIGGEGTRFRVAELSPGERLVLVDEERGAFNGVSLDVAFTREKGGTRVVLSVDGLRAEHQDRVPMLRSAWTCALAILKEYLEAHEGMPRDQLEARGPAAPNPLSVATALRSAEAIQHWAGETPERILAATAHAAVVKFRGHDGVFTITGLGSVSVRYTVWGGRDARDAEQEAQHLVDRFIERVQAPAREAR